ncbi:TonB-dependent receptor plug domain-containing protein [Flammeovirga sp. SubArs3]|uniref:TonB-dependent receptor plug domain-containing protein n=1 Tax=Flammeovirga sp. SubArs3 TaxID=2995316 RepID=UPI00248B4D2A|nr:TonB-dependent receptor plug domain-containing protein [Flammeovirga sp. SubArs3]
MNLKSFYNSSLFFMILFGGPLSAQTINDSIASVSTTEPTNIVVGYQLNQQQLGTLGGPVGALVMTPGAQLNGKSQLSFRGLSPGYNAVYLDGILAPSTETSTKAFSFKMIPSSAISEMDIYTTGAAGISGEFGGAAIAMHSKNKVSKNFNIFSVKLGYLPQTTGQDFYQPINYGGAADFFGFGVDKRNFSNDIASPDQLQNMSRNESAAQAAQLENVWGINKTTALPNMGMSYYMGRDLGGSRVKVSTVNGFSFDKSSKTAYSDRYGYSGYETDASGTVVGSRTKYYNNDHIYQQNTQLNMVSNWNFEFNPKSTISVSNYFLHHANNMFSLRHGLEYDDQYERLMYATDYITSSVYMGRINGQHLLGVDEKTSVKWALGYSHTTRNEPDYRISGAQRLMGTTGDFYLLIPRSSKADAGSRYASQLKENTYSARTDFARKLTNEITLKAGLYAEYSERGFDSRLTSFAQDDNTAYELRYPSASEIGSIFSPENFGPNGYYLIDGTRPSDSYYANSKLMAEYIGVELPISKSTFMSTGVRIETFDQTLNSDTVQVNNNSTDILPYINITQKDHWGGAWTASYAKTINRPAFRELAPFTYYDFEWRTDISGNPDLENTEIHNFEIGYSKSFQSGMRFSASAFYKYLDNPIEKAYRIRSESPMFTYENSESAQVYGVAVQWITPLSTNKHHWLNDFTLMTNASYVYSQVALSEESQEASSTRALQGQAPYTVNMALSYTWKKQVFSLMYYTQGMSLYTVGDGQETYPWYLMPVHHLGFKLKRNVTDKLDFSFTAQNLLNAKATFYEDANMDGQINPGNGADKLIREVEVGPSFTFGLSVKF